MKTHYEVQKKERFPQDTVLEMCERIASEGITVDKEQYDGTRKTYECGAFLEQGLWQVMSRRKL